MELFNEVGKTIHAVPISAIEAVRAPSHVRDAGTSVTNKMHRLEERCLLLEQDHIRAVEESEQWQLQAVANLQLKSSAEAELATARTELRSTHAIIQDLRRELETSSSTVEALKRLGASSAWEIDDIFGRLKKVRSGLSLVAESPSML